MISESESVEMKTKPYNFNILVACEESQAVTTAFRLRGFNAFSCDLQPCSGAYPEYHFQRDVLCLLADDDFSWDLIIAHPPCTYLTFAAARYHSLSCVSEEYIRSRTFERISAELFFMRFTNPELAPHIAIENPCGVMNTVYRQPDQIIHPYQFAESVDSPDYVTKRTCLWLYNLPCLYTNSLPVPDNSVLFGCKPTGKAKTWTEVQTGNRAVMRSKTFPSVANAMAEQWGNFLLNEYKQLSFY